MSAVGVKVTRIPSGPDVEIWISDPEDAPGATDVRLHRRDEFGTWNPTGAGFRVSIIAAALLAEALAGRCRRQQLVIEAGLWAPE